MCKENKASFTEGMSRGEHFPSRNPCRDGWGKKEETRRWTQCPYPSHGKDFFILDSLPWPVRHKTLQRLLQQSVFGRCLDEMSAIIRPENEAVFNMDNYTAHKRLIPRYPFHIIKFLPPYSPYLNPIEFTFLRFQSRGEETAGFSIGSLGR